MSKLLSIAFAEYRQVVFTKSFIISLLFPIIIYGGMFVVTALFGDKVDIRDRELLVVDRTNILGEFLLEASMDYNRGEDVVDNEGKQIGPRFLVEMYEGDIPPDNETLMLELSDRVREDEIFAFLIIGEDYLSIEAGDNDYIHYYSDSPTFTRLPDWASRELRDQVETIRFRERGYDQREINQITSHNRLERFKLAQRDADGNVIQPDEENRIAAFLIPFGILMLIFISIQMTTPVLLNSVIEEKMRRIAEVLLASVSPFQLLMGKLLGGVGVGLTFSATYMLSLALSLRYFERANWIAEGAYGWFFIFALVGMLSFGALFAAVSAASQDLKDTQNFAGVIILLLVIPLAFSIVVVEVPDGPLATVVSFIPPISVMTMMTRVAIPPGPEMWQVLLSLGLNVVFAIFAVWAASRIFRIGILSQGKTPEWKELIRWVFRRE